MRALLTDMDQPLGDAIGNAAEVREAIDVLRGGGPADVRALTVRLGAEMLVLGGVARDRRDGARRIEAAIASGAGLERFRLGVRLQGGDPRAIDDPRRLPRARHTRVDPRRARAASSRASTPACSAARRRCWARAACARRTASRPAPRSCCTRRSARAVARGDALATVECTTTPTRERAPRAR